MTLRGVYVHWPFCARICPYCDFNVRKARAVDEDAWADGFARQLDRLADGLRAAPAASVFFGGGTPSLMAPATIERVLDMVDRRIGLAADAEITLEANPTDAEAEKFGAFRQAGVDRLSLGVQSFDDAELRFLGRNHDGAEAARACRVARDVFANVSFDLIYALPDQTPAAWRGILGRALAFDPDHLSPYQLTLEPGTAFARRAGRGARMTAEEDASAELYDLTQDLCEAAGLSAYEVSNHARPGRESRHNQIYWTEGEWLGLGPGAHGRLVDIEGARIATTGGRDPQAWLSAVAAGGDGLVERDILTAEESAHEALAMGLRARGGVAAARLEAAGLTIDRRAWAAMRAEGFLMEDEGRLIATAKGRLVLDRIMVELLADRPARIARP